MDEDKIEQLLKEAKTLIPVDYNLKKSLRTSFKKKQRKKYILPSLFGIAAAAIFFFAFFMSSNQNKNVAAEELLITNALSFFDVADGDILALAHHDGQLYVSIRAKGIFLKNSNGLEKLDEYEADSMSLNDEGTLLAFSQKGSIYVLDLKNRKSKLVLAGNNTVQHKMPQWKDNHELYFSQQIGEKKQLMLLSLDNGKEEMITELASTSFAQSKSFIVYEEADQLVKMDLKTQSKTIIDKGKAPSITKDGQYIAYIKEENGLEDVWIADGNLNTKKKVTVNLQQRTSQQPLYHYRSPIWDSEERILYTIKDRMFEKEIEDTRIMKIELGTEKLTAEKTVEQFMQALMTRDDDYAKTLMKEPPEYLTTSSPRITGYKIIQAINSEHSAKIQVEVIQADGHLPYTNVVNYEFILKQTDGGAIIESITELDRMEVSSSDLQTLQLIKGDAVKRLFSLSDLGKREEIKSTNIRLSSVVFDSANNRVMFGVQEMGTGNERFGISIWSYDIEKEEFTFVKRMDTLESHQDIVLSGLNLSPDQRYIAVRFIFRIRYYSICLYPGFRKRREIDSAGSFPYSILER